MRAVLTTPLLLLIAIGLLTTASVFGFPAHPRYFVVLNNFAHAPVFGALAIVNLLIVKRHSRYPPRNTIAIAFLATVAIGVGIELIQPSIGRDGELRDVAMDALGAAAGLALFALLRPGPRQLPAIILVFAMTLALWPIFETVLSYWERSRQAPAILEISSRFDWTFIWTHGVQITQEELPAGWRRPDDPKSVGVQFKYGSGRVLSVTEPIPDWRRYDRLLVDLTNPEAQPLLLTLRVHDRTHNHENDDRFNRLISVPVKTRMMVEVPLVDLAKAPSRRRMDLSQIAGVMIFADGRAELAGRRFYLTRIWLEQIAN